MPSYWIVGEGSMHIPLTGYVHTNDTEYIVFDLEWTGRRFPVTAQFLADPAA